MTAPSERRQLPGPDSPGYWATENRIARDMAEARADYEIAMWKAIGQPEARREDVPADFLENYDWLRSPTVIRTNEAIIGIHAKLIEIENGDLSRMVSDEHPTLNYLQGLILSLETSIHIPDPDFENKPPVEAADNRSEIVEHLADAKAEEVKCRDEK